MEQLWGELAVRARDLFGLRLSEAQLVLLRSLSALILSWSGKVNLVSVSSEEDLVWRHLLDSLAPVPLILDAGVGAFVDVGSGGGLPGIPMAVASGVPGLLVESRQRRAAFLRHAVRSLELANLAVRSERAEDVRCDPVPALVGRGVAPEVLVSSARRLLTSDGVLVLMLKADQLCPKAEEFAVEREIGYELPGGYHHRVVLLRRGCFT